MTDSGTSISGDENPENGNDDVTESSPTSTEQDDTQHVNSNEGKNPFDVDEDIPKRVLTKDILKYFNRTKRSDLLNEQIRQALIDHNLAMTPQIEDADYYGSVELKRRDAEVNSHTNGSDSSGELANDMIEESSVTMTGSVLSSLKLDGSELDFLTYGMTIPQALDEMNDKGRTRMPLFFSDSDSTTLIGTVRAVDLISSEVTKSRRLIECAMIQVPVVSTTEKLFDWIPSILQHGFIYGKDGGNRVVQIYTTKDVASHLHSLSQMFMRVHEIEGLLRSTLSRIPKQEIEDALKSAHSLEEIKDIDGNNLFSKEEISGPKSENVEHITQTFTFAQYLKCLNHEPLWKKYFANALKHSQLDRDKCLHSLNDARLARNKVMHMAHPDVVSALSPSFECLAVWLRKVAAAHSAPNQQRPKL